MTTRQRALAASCVFGGSVFLALVFTSPSLIKAYPSLIKAYASRNLLDPVRLESKTHARYAGPVIQVVPIIRIQAPAVLRGNDGDRLSVSVEKALWGHSDAFPGSPFRMQTDQPVKWDTKDVERPFTVQLAVGNGLAIDPIERRVEKSFKDARSLGEPPLNWHWALTAKSAGQHKLLLQGLPLNEFRTKLEQPSDPSQPTPVAEILSDGTLQLTILALTSLGLTARQDAILKAIQGVAGFIGVVLAYPFFKRLFDAASSKKDKNTPRRRRR